LKRAAFIGAVLLIGCGEQFEPISELETLRVLAVQKSAPYADPGEEVELRMLWFDGAAPPARSIQRTWISGCYNPPADQYAGCFEALGAALGGQAEGPSPPVVDLEALLNQAEGERVCFDAEETVCVGSGDRFSFNLPESIVADHAPSQDPTQPRYGLAFTFFAVCAGRLVLDPAVAAERAFPILCLDESGEPLGASDYVAGYSSLYAFEDFDNANPEITGFVFNGESVSPSCIGADCLDAPMAIEECSADAVATVPVCPHDDPDDCPGYAAFPRVAESSIEIDEVTNATRDRTLREQMWIRYFVDEGAVSSAVRLVSDATTGPIPEARRGTELKAPSTPGPVNLWAVVQDNRGGANWARIEVCAQ